VLKTIIASGSCDIRKSADFHSNLKHSQSFDILGVSMKHTLFNLLILISACLVIISLFNGCSIFGPVGHAISQGYENSVSYFNGYYNAKWLFDEAEDEVKEDILKKRGQDSTNSVNYKIPPATKEKFVKVIDKCSNILAFHSTSTLVDDALILIGKSFYYQSEYLKAERKFSELLTQYPASPLVLETQIWYARTEEKLMKVDASINMCESAITAAKASNNIEIEVQAHTILGELYLKQKQIDKAVMEFKKLIELADDDDIKVEAQMNLGSIYFSEERYDKAAETFLKVRDYTSDPYSNYYSTMQAAVAYRKINEFKKGLALLNEMIENFRYKPYLPDLLFERANNYAASGKRNEAIDEYIYVDTVFVNTEYGRRSAYQLGIIYEKEIGDYQSSSKYYKELVSAAASKYSDDSRQKYNALTGYFSDQKKLQIADSLLFALTDTTKKTIVDTLAEEIINADKPVAELSAVDTLTAGVTNPAGRRIRQNNPRLSSQAADSLSSVSDTTKRKIEAVAPGLMESRFDSLKTLRSLLDSAKSTFARVSSQKSRIKADSLASLKFIVDSLKENIFLFSSKIADSLDVLKSIAAQDLGDIFFTELAVPDSAIFWYKKSIDWSYDPLRSPRILYILAELSRLNTGEENKTPEYYYLRLDRDFPESIYAKEARRLLGKEISGVKADSAAMYYEQAEKHIDKNQYDNAIKMLRNIAQSNPKSPLAAKSEYAIGWILENNLKKPEDANTQYERVVKNYRGTKYALDAMIRSKALVRNYSLKQDSATVSDTKVNKPGIKNTPTDSIKISPAIMDTLKINRVKTDTITAGKSDTSRLNTMKIDTSRMKTIKVDSSGIKSGSIDKKALNSIDSKKDSIISRKKIAE
jgi:TolA-binding protein